MTNSNDSTFEVPWNPWLIRNKPQNKQNDTANPSWMDERLDELARFDTAIELLAKRKKLAGRYYYHPVPVVSTLTKYYTTEAVISGWLGYPEEVTARLPREQGLNVRIKPHSPAPLFPGVLHGYSSTKTTGLAERVHFLEGQLQCDRPYLQLYRLGAGGLLGAVTSLVVWVITGIGIPFHPIFAAGVIPLSIAVIAMAFLIRPTSASREKGKQ